MIIITSVLLWQQPVPYIVSTRIHVTSLDARSVMVASMAVVMVVVAVVVVMWLPISSPATYSGYTRTGLAERAET